jgi:hypothetical protein
MIPATGAIGLETGEYNRPIRVNHNILAPWILWCGATIALQRILESQGYPQTFPMAVGAAHKLAELCQPLRGTAADGSTSLLYPDVCYVVCFSLRLEDGLNY